jgi:hypothetical protein
LGKTGKDTELTFDSSILLIYPSYISVSVPVASFWEPPVSESQYRTFVWSYRWWSAAAVTALFWTRRNGAQPLIQSFWEFWGWFSALKSLVFCFFARPPPPNNSRKFLS